MSVIRFFSEAAGEVIMLGGMVEPIMKRSEIVFHDKGAFLAEDLAEVIEKIENTLDELTLIEQAPKENDDRDDDEAKQKRKDFVALRIRFYPLLELMNKALKKGKHVYWATLWLGSPEGARKEYEDRKQLQAPHEHTERTNPKMYRVAPGVVIHRPDFTQAWADVADTRPNTTEGRHEIDPSGQNDESTDRDNQKM